MKRTIKQILLLSTALTILSGCSQGASQANMQRMGQVEQSVSVEVEPITRGDLSVTKKIVGDVLSESEVEVLPEVAGALLSLHVKVGDVVEKGQVLADVDASEVQKILLEAQVSSESARQQLENSVISKLQSDKDLQRVKALKIRWDEAVKELEKSQVLYQEEIISRSELEQAQQAEQEARISYENDVASSEANIQKAQLAVEQAQLNVKKAELTVSEAQGDLNSAAITAPHSGEIVSIAYSVGENVSAQQPLFIISDTANLKVKTQVTSDQKALLPKGHVVDVVTAKQDQSYKASVIYVAGVTNENGLYDVELNFTVPGVKVTSGQVVQLTFTDTIVKDELLVPTKTILQKGDKRFVYIVEEGKAAQKEVQIINTQTEQTAVKGDIKVGDSLIINGHKLVSDGMNVELPGQAPASFDGNGGQQRRGNPAPDSPARGNGEAGGGS